MPRLKNDPRTLAAVAATRQRLLDAACDEFCEVPFFETDTNKIARRANLSPGTFYNHFADKIEIFAEAFERLNAEEVAEITARTGAARDSGASFVEIIDVMVDTLLACRQRQALIRLQADVLKRTEIRVRDAKMRVRLNNIGNMKQAMANRGIVQVSDGELHLNMYVINLLADGIVNGEFRMYGVDNKFARDEIRRRFIACYAGLGSGGSPSAAAAP
ncbi:MAG: TetR/AcrR family transcriptional regulator [Alphaproteobacteria bacterium]|jgi:AcrR family transcriptional regulator|nr:TetR/AcrR family transcriptional regulator [Alphaproteobacteria bacterium]